MATTHGGLPAPAFQRGETPALQLSGRRNLRFPPNRDVLRPRGAAPKGLPLPFARSSNRGTGWVLVLTFLSSAVANRVANRILLVPMAKHSLFLSLATSAAQLAAYALLLLSRSWQQPSGRPFLLFVADFWIPLFLTGLCEGCFYPLVFSAAAKLPGGLVQVLNQSIVPYTVLFSALLMGRSYEPLQLLGVAVVLLGVLFAVGMPLGALSLQGGAWQDVLQCTGAYSLLAMGVTLKDLVFKQSQTGEVQMPQDLIILTVCAACAAVQISVQLLAFPLAVPELEQRKRLISAGWHSLLGASAPAAPWIALTYWACNVAFSLCTLRLVRKASAATVVLANVAALPLSALVFCCPLPLLERQPFRWSFACSLILVVVGNLLYGSTSWRRR